MEDIIGAGLIGAGGNMVIVSVSETYDLSTKPNKMSLIALHTPSREIIKKTYPGLCMNCKYVRIVKQDVTMACASMLPADPLQVGVSSGDIAPQDMFNPILYKAISTESLSILEARIVGLQAQPSQNVFNGESVEKTDDATNMADDFAVYYALLSNRDGFRTASPQAGFSMKGLVPLVFEKYYPVGANSSSDGNTAIIRENSAGNGLEVSTWSGRSMRGRAHPMPRFNTTYVTGVSKAGETGVNRQENGMTNGHPYNCQVEMPTIPIIYTGAIIMPPSKLNQLYYRMVVRTYIEFSEVRPIQEISSFAELATYYTPEVYGSDYSTVAKTMTSQMAMVDTQNADITKIMDGM
ncbi:putative capsid protein [Odonata-associated circular virus 21]|uniref:Putative capsid protein n=1 Tax=Odonata-associated circular virus 21 TaxID=1592122 RepID=A0A0B4UH63_9VIRU|nr:putative capsid protein [Odonata-associated circular virus 21]AJD07509.1 putative capsid protein [Odonata-associated circular virus 21]